MSGVTISSRFQITIPKELRQKLALRRGQEVFMFERDGQLRIVCKRIEELRGIAKGTKWRRDYRDHADRF